jgi:excisionase family DNA binding protein
MPLSAQQAADILGVSRMQISRLVRQGDLEASRLGNALVIDSDSVNQYRTLRPDRGRPLSPRNAWARILEASARLDVADSDHDLIEVARQLAIVARRRAERHPFRVQPNRVQAVLDDPRLVLSGADAGQRHSAPVRPGEPHLAYASSDDLAQLVTDHRLRDDVGQPNVIIRAVSPDQWILSHRIAPPLVAAIDSLDELDARSATEILRHLARSGRDQP